jgi:hypothetical protein
MILVVIHGAMCAHQLAGLPNTDLVLLVHITDQFPFFSRPYNFFSITSFRTVI